MHNESLSFAEPVHDTCHRTIPCQQEMLCQGLSILRQGESWDWKIQILNQPSLCLWIGGIRITPVRFDFSTVVFLLLFQWIQNPNCLLLRQVVACFHLLFHHCRCIILSGLLSSSIPESLKSARLT